MEMMFLLPGPSEFAEERQVDEAEHVVGRAERRCASQDPDENVERLREVGIGQRGGEDLILGKEAGERREAGDGNRGDEKRPVGDGDLLAKPAKGADVLLT